MQRSSRPSRRAKKASINSPEDSLPITSTTLPSSAFHKTAKLLLFSFLVLCAILATFSRSASTLTTSISRSNNYFNCTSPLSNLPQPDLPYDQSTLWDLKATREYIRREQPGIEAYYDQQDKLETFIRTKFNRKPSVLELGGNNGWFADDLFPIIMAHEWPAIIVEALPHQYALLVRNYGEKYHQCWWSGLQFVNTALVDQKKEVSMSFQNTNGWQRGGGSVLRHQNEDGWQTMMVPGDTLEAVLKTVQYTDIDLIQIDIEGLDEAMLKQVDGIMDTIYPRMVCVETCDDNYCQEFWKKHGFTEFRAPGQICGTRGF